MRQEHIAYSDGDVESEIFGALKRTTRLSSDENIAPEMYERSWAFEYHLSTVRKNLFAHVDFADKAVLEIGAGMGALSRHIAESASELTVVEGTERRLTCLQERLRDLRNWKSYCGNFKNFESTEKFDKVLIIGVLEYADLYFRDDSGANPYESFVNHAKSFLKPNGQLVIAIENRFGMKYWNGAREDHTGRTYEGTCGYLDIPSVRTFSKREIEALLRRTGLSHLSFAAPFPDYKTPRAVLEERLHELDPRLFCEIAGTFHARDHGSPREFNTPENLAWRGMAESGLGMEFANSFLITASETPLPPPGMLATIFSSSLRRTPVQTQIHETPNGLVVRKSTPKGPPEDDILKWRNLPSTEVLRGERLVTSLGNLLEFAPEEAFWSRWVGYLDHVFARFSTETGELEGRTWDLVPSNVIVSSDGHLHPFDLEWDAGTMPKSWLILRAIGSFPETAFLRLRQRYGSGRVFYEKTCMHFQLNPEFDRDVSREARSVRQVLFVPEDYDVQIAQKFNLAATQFESPLFDTWGETTQDKLGRLRKAGYTLNTRVNELNECVRQQEILIRRMSRNPGVRLENILKRIRRKAIRLLIRPAKS